MKLKELIIEALEKWEKDAAKTKTPIDDFVVQLLKGVVNWFL